MKNILLVATMLIIVISSYYVYTQLSIKPIQKIVPVSVSVKQDCTVSDLDVIKSVNKYRAEKGVAPVTFSSKLNQFANERAVSENGVLDEHAGFYPRVHELFDTYPYVDEIQGFVAGCHNSDERVGLFVLSDKHWKALMDSRYNYAGAGFYNNVLVIDFGQAI